MEINSGEAKLGDTSSNSSWSRTKAKSCKQAWTLRGRYQTPWFRICFMTQLLESPNKRLSTLARQSGRFPTASITHLFLPHEGRDEGSHGTLPKLFIPFPCLSAHSSPLIDLSSLAYILLSLLSSPDSRETRARARLVLFRKSDVWPELGMRAVRTPMRYSTVLLLSTQPVSLDLARSTEYERDCWILVSKEGTL